MTTEVTTEVTTDVVLRTVEGLIMVPIASRGVAERLRLTSHVGKLANAN